MKQLVPRNLVGSLATLQASTRSVLHVVAPARTGGLEQVVRSLASTQAGGGYRVGVAVALSPGDAGHPFLVALEGLGAVQAFPIYMPARAYGREVSALAELCRGFKPQLLHTHGYRPDVLGGIAARRAGLPQVSTAHGFTGGSLKNRLFEWLEVRAWRRADAVIAVSRALASDLLRRGVREQRVHVVPNAWRPLAPAHTREEARRILGLPATGALIGWVGRLSREKGPDVMISALALLPAGEARLVMVGEGRDSRMLGSLAHRLGVADRIHWAGEVPEAGRLFRAFDCFVLSSRTEGTPMVLFEAMAAGTPVVATAVGGVPDVISPSEGWLVESDVPAGLAEAIGAVLGDPHLAATRSRAAGVRLEESFSASSWTAQYDAVYEQVLGARKGGGGV